MATYPVGGVPEFVASTELLASQLNALVDAFNAMFFLGFVGYASGYSGTTTENLLNGVWLEMNGVAVSRTTYSALNTLYSGAGYPYGSGDGSTTFNLPPASGRPLIHHPGSTGHADVKTLGATDAGVIGARSPKHQHTVSLSAASHTHSGSSLTVPSVLVIDSSNAKGGSGSGNVGEAGTAAVSGNTGATAPSVTGTVGVTGRGTDTGSFLVGGIYVVKAFA